MDKKYKILLATLGLIGVYFFVIRKKNNTIKNNYNIGDNSITKDLSQNSNADNILIQPIKPINPSTTINQNISSQDATIGGIKYQSNQSATAQQATNLEITKGWEQLENLIKFSSDPNNPTMSFLDPIAANMSYDAYNAMVQQTIDAYNTQTDYMQQVLDSFMSGNPLNLQGTYYQLPTGKYGFFIHSNNTGGMCPTNDYNYNGTTGICELLS